MDAVKEIAVETVEGESCRRPTLLGPKAAARGRRGARLPHQSRYFIGRSAAANCVDLAASVWSLAKCRSQRRLLSTIYEGRGAPLCLTARRKPAARPLGEGDPYGMIALSKPAKVGTKTWPARDPDCHPWQSRKSSGS